MKNYLWYDIEISQDNFPDSPRTDSNLWTMLCNHWRYDLWDDKLESHWESFWQDFMIHINNDYDISDNDELNSRDYQKIETWIKNEVVFFPLYLYDHSWITMKTGPFQCQFDSWMVWYIYATKSDIREWNDITCVHSHHIEDTKRLLENEVKQYDKYLTGDIYEFNIKLLDERCWWFESEEDAFTEAKDIIESQDPEGKIMKESDRIYQLCMGMFWNNFDALKNESDIIDNEDWETDEFKEDLLTHIVGEKLKQY